MFSSEGLNQASPWVCEPVNIYDGETRKIKTYWTEDPMQYGVEWIVVHGRGGGGELIIEVSQESKVETENAFQSPKRSCDARQGV